MEWKHGTEFPAEGASIDLLFAVDSGRVAKFSINLSVLCGGEALDVYRVDTAHGRLHEQKFWQTGEPIWLEERGKADYSREFAQYRELVAKNWARWTRLFKEKRER